MDLIHRVAQYPLEPALSLKSDPTKAADLEDEVQKTSSKYTVRGK